MKKLLKSEICGTVNSAWIHHERKKRQNMRLKRRKKKKREGKHANVQNANVLCIQTAPNSHIMKYIGNRKYFYTKYFVIKEHGILLGNCQTSRLKNWTIKEVQICFFPKILRRCLKLLFKQYFSVFKQHYIYFYLFLFLQNNNIIKNLLLNVP